MSNNSYYNFLIDDDKSGCNLFKDALREISRRTQRIPFTNPIGLRANQADENCQPLQIILVDLNLPIISGNEGLSILRKNNYFKNPPVVICVISFIEELVNRVKLLGIDLYNLKAASLSQSKSSLERYLSSLLQIEARISLKINFTLNDSI